MEDLATARISVAQTAQRIIHSVPSEDTQRKHDMQVIIEIADSELEDILEIRKLDRNNFDNDMKHRYEAAHEMTIRWVSNYTKLKFDSLATYDRDLHKIS